MRNRILYGALKTLYLDDHFIPKVLDPLYTLVYLSSRNYSRALPLPYISQVVASGVISTTSIDIESHLKPVVSLLFLSILCASYYSISTDFIRRII